jgi:hypothetical protein
MERRCIERHKAWDLLTGDKYHRIGTDGGQQLGRCLSFLVSGVTEEEQEGSRILYLFTDSLRVAECFMRSYPVLS